MSYMTLKIVINKTPALKRYNLFFLNKLIYNSRYK